MQGPQRYPRKGDRSPVIYRLLALENQTDLNSSLSPHLARFVALFASRLCFRFAGSLIVGIINDKKNLPILTRVGKEKLADRSMKNLLTHWKLRRKTDFKLEPRWLFFADLVSRLKTRS